MGYDVYGKGKKPTGQWHRTFGQMDAYLTPQLVKDLRLEAALRRISDALLSKYKKNGESVTIGVAFEAVSFNFILDNAPGIVDP